MPIPVVSVYLPCLHTQVLPMCLSIDVKKERERGRRRQWSFVVRKGGTRRPLSHACCRRKRLMELCLNKRRRERKNLLLPCLFRFLRSFVRAKTTMPSREIRPTRRKGPLIQDDSNPLIRYYLRCMPAVRTPYRSGLRWRKCSSARVSLSWRLCPHPGTEAHRDRERQPRAKEASLLFLSVQPGSSGQWFIPSSCLGAFLRPNYD